MAKKLYVGNLSYETTESDLRDLFAEFGTVATVTLIKDRDTGTSKGFAFVEMETQEGADQARQKLNNSMMNNRALKIDEARPPSAGGGGGSRGAVSSRSYSGGSSRGYGGGGGGGGGYGGGYGGNSRSGSKKRGKKRGGNGGSASDYGGW